MPGISTVTKWLGEDEFPARYARAREVQTEHLAGELLEIADDASENVQRSRLRVDARKWLMARMAPKKYGDKLQHTGEGGEGPVRHSLTVGFVNWPPKQQ